MSQMSIQSRLVVLRVSVTSDHPRQLMEADTNLVSHIRFGPHIIINYPEPASLTDVPVEEQHVLVGSESHEHPSDDQPQSFNQIGLSSNPQYPASGDTMRTEQLANVSL
jgi:hypothetical protein